MKSRRSNVWPVRVLVLVLFVSIVMLPPCVASAGEALGQRHAPVAHRLSLFAALPLSGDSPSSVLSLAPATNNTWDRIVMIGASATAGFTESEPLGGPNTSYLRLSRYVDSALTAPHQPVRNLSSTFFFMQPEQQAQRQIELAREAKPSLVIAVDFLFWFCYGDGPTDRDRALRFEYGLKLCERIHCLLVLGDIPDASAALNHMLTPDEMPSSKAIGAANRRLREWAGSHRNVVLLPLSAFMNAIRANQPLSIHGRTIPAGKTAPLLQGDRLHPSGPGCAALALMALDALRGTAPPALLKQVRWDPSDVFRRAYQQPTHHANNHDTPPPSAK